MLYYIILSRYTIPYYIRPEVARLWARSRQLCAATCPSCFSPARSPVDECRLDWPMVSSRRNGCDRKKLEMSKLLKQDQREEPKSGFLVGTSRQVQGDGGLLVCGLHNVLTARKISQNPGQRGEDFKRVTGLAVPHVENVAGAWNLQTAHKTQRGVGNQSRCKLSVQPCPFFCKGSHALCLQWSCLCVHLCDHARKARAVRTSRRLCLSVRNVGSHSSRHCVALAHLPASRASGQLAPLQLIQAEPFVWTAKRTGQELPTKPVYTTEGGMAPAWCGSGPSPVQTLEVHPDGIAHISQAHVLHPTGRTVVARVQAVKQEETGHSELRLHKTRRAHLAPMYSQAPLMNQDCAVRLPAAHQASEPR